MSAIRAADFSGETEPVRQAGAARRDRALMRAALFQAWRGLGRTWPNPSVGAVLADPGTGEIIASAVTGQGGRPHAEALALAEAGHRARGAVMVTTLEPCSHFGVTPPCADAIAEAGVAEVLYGAPDPDPRVSGAGVARLAAKGIRVRLAPYTAEAAWLTLGHALRVTEHRPFVQLKLAVDADGFVAAGEGQPVWVTDEEARARAHLLRAQADAILVGRNTVLRDNPRLTSRLPGLAARSPVRVVLTSQGQIPVDIELFTEPGPPVWVVAGADTPHHVIARLESAGARVFPVALSVSATGWKSRLSIRSVLGRLADEGITRLLVEGGPTVARAFFDAEAADEILVFQGSRRMPPAAQQLRPFVTDGLPLLAQSPRYRKVEVSRAGNATVKAYRLRAHLEG